MALRLHNTLTKNKEKFVPIEKGKVGIYTCGPTVYSFAHVGNFRAYVFSDILKRVLIFNGFDVKHIINVTDVGHLTSDADLGEDKMEKAAVKEGKTAKEISNYYFDAFHKDFLKLNLIEPLKWTWATKEIPEQIDMIKTLEEKGYTYPTSDGIYFDTSKFEDYGAWNKSKLENLEGGKRVDLNEKKNKTDFALWKFSPKDEKRQQEWESPWGSGFPGWHIECSAMAAKYLGKTFDIHTGGEDHLFIHHPNEIAQSTCCFEVKPCNFWMHSAFLNIKGGKMSKSLGNVERISDLEKRGIDVLAFRYLCLTASYRKPLTWSEDALQGAATSYKKLKNIALQLLKECEDNEDVNEEYLARFLEKVNDDLDLPGGLAVAWDLVKSNENWKVGTLKKMDEVLGLDLFSCSENEVPRDVLELAEKREIARKNKDWEKSDELRDLILEKGFVLKDFADGFILEKKK